MNDTQLDTGDSLVRAMDIAARERSRDPYVGQTFKSRYRIDEKIGAGGMGMVYKAFDLKLERIVAVKVLVLPANVTEDQARDLLRRFDREAKSAGRLTNQNVVIIHDLDQADEGPFFIVMEYVGGGLSLSKLLLQKGRLGVHTAINFAIQMLDALEEIHGAGILHRDLKPANVLLTGRDGLSLKICDFGVGKFLGNDLALDATQTAVGTIAGTPKYMSVEQLQGRSVDERSDLYAIGVIFYEMIAGSVPFPGKEAIHVLNAHQQRASQPPTLAETMGRRVHSALEAFVKTALEPNPDRRFQTAAEMREALDTLDLTEAKRTSHLGVVTAAILAIVLGTGGFAWYQGVLSPSKARTAVTQTVGKIEKLVRKDAPIEMPAELQAIPPVAAETPSASPEQKPLSDQEMRKRLVTSQRLYDQGKYAEAAALAEAHIADRPQSTEAWHVLARSSSLLPNQKEAAREAMRTFLQLEPGTNRAKLIRQMLAKSN